MSSSSATISSSDEHVAKKRRFGKLRTPGWHGLRAVGNLPFLKVSYLLLVFIPVLTTQNVVTDFLGFGQWLLAVTFFASLSLAVANLVYDVSCPSVIKRFASPNDLYEKMLEIARLSRPLYPRDGFQASLDHCKTSYKSFSNANHGMRRVCWWTYLISLALFGVLFLNRAWVVTRGLL